MQNFAEWLEDNDAELYNEVDWNKWKQRAKHGAAGVALATGLGAGMMPSTGDMGTGKVDPLRQYNVSQSIMRGDQQAQDKYSADLARAEKGDFSDSGATMSPTEVNAITHSVEATFSGEMQNMPDSHTELIEVVSTKNVEEGLLIVLEYHGTQMARSQEEANQQAVEYMTRIARGNGISIEGTQVLGESYNWQAEWLEQTGGGGMKVSLKVSLLVPHGWQPKH